MNAFSKVDMSEVTRLVQAGKLTEATALLQGRPASRGGDENPRAGALALAGPSWSTVDTAVPLPRRGAWPEGRGGGEPRRPSTLAGLADIAGTMGQLRDRLGALASRPGGGAGIAEGRRPAVPVPDGARFEERSFSGDGGSRTYKVYVPSGYTGQTLPLVVMLHGCTQNPDDFAAGTRMNELAEEQTFLVAYPHQPGSANPQKCWNWFDVAEQQRGSGEPSLIAGIALAVIREFSADPARVYVAGLSAGGAAAAIMAQTYPDLFAAVGVHSGLACGAARDMPSAFAAMGRGGTVPPHRDGPMVPTIVFHGDADRTVNAVNSDHVIAQATPEEALTRVVTRGETPAGMAYTRIAQFDDVGTNVLEQWVLHGAGHAWSGGSAQGSYTDARGPDASREMVRFFLTHAKPTRERPH